MFVRNVPLVLFAYRMDVYWTYTVCDIYRVELITLRCSWICKITGSHKNLSCKASSYELVSELRLDRTNKRPMRNYWQLHAQFRCDDREKLACDRR